MNSTSLPNGYTAVSSIESYIRDMGKNQPVYAFEMAILTEGQNKFYGEWLKKLGFELTRESTSLAHGRHTPRQLFLYVRVNDVDRPAPLSLSPYDWVYERL